MAAATKAGEPKARIRKPTLKAVHDAVVAAGGLRREAQAAIASQAFPYIVDMLDGFAVQMQPGGPDEERTLRVYFREGAIEVRFHDTIQAGTTLIDDAVIDRILAPSWAGAEAFMLRHGVAMQAGVDGKPATVGSEGNALMVSQVAPGESVPGIRAKVTFTSRRSWLVTAVLSPAGKRIEALDWVLVQHRLKLAGVSIEPKAVAAAA